MANRTTPERMDEKPAPAKKKVSRARRRFLIGATVLGGGLLVGLYFWPRRDWLGDPALLLPKQGEVALNAWVKIASDGTVTIAVPRSEMGQGVYTALPMLLAEELNVDWNMVRVEQAGIDRVYGNVQIMMDAIPGDPDNDGTFKTFARWASKTVGTGLGIQLTGGSTSVRDAWEPMRMAGAIARDMLIAAAARQWDVPPGECVAESGQVIHGASGRIVDYAEVAVAAAELSPPKQLPTLKDAASYKLLGKPLPRLDVPEKTNGGAVFGIDVRQPDMLYAAIKIAPVFGGTVKSFDANSVSTLPGVYDVVEIPDGVVVVADSYWRAKKAVNALPVEFDDGANAQLDSEAIYARLQSELDSGDANVAEDHGDIDGALATAAATHEAEYRVPYQAHACMEPINCTAKVSNDSCEVWVSNQAPTLVQMVAAKTADVPTDNVTVHTTFLGGGFGRRFELDVVTQAVRVALKTKGRPVKLIWSREEDIQHDVYRPAVLSRFRAGLDADGSPSAWLNRLASPSVGYAVSKRNMPFASTAMPDRSNTDGAAHLPYGIPGRRVEHVTVASPVPVGFWRSVGHSHNAFFTECFIDELAHKAGRDPFEYRRALLADRPRHRAVLEMAADKADWDTPLPAGSGRGIALHESFASIVAQVAEMTVTGNRVKVDRVVCVIDCGQVVNPSIVEAQMESGIVFGLSAALFGEITLKSGRVEQSNFPNYPVVTLATMPRIDTHIVESQAAPGGVGEPGTPPIAPAVANAVFATIGKRLRRLPINAALEQSA
ncbi:MAG: molybdopterin cofactor-binding domain-containing protein [Gammaproteobacteria bacterium]